MPPGNLELGHAREARRPCRGGDLPAHVGADEDGEPGRRSSELSPERPGREGVSRHSAKTEWE